MNFKIVYPTKRRKLNELKTNDLIYLFYNNSFSDCIDIIIKTKLEGNLVIHVCNLSEVDELEFIIHKKARNVLLLNLITDWRINGVSAADLDPTVIYKFIFLTYIIYTYI
jgi:hypothetical protein